MWSLELFWIFTLMFGWTWFFFNYSTSNFIGTAVIAIGTSSSKSSKSLWNCKCCYKVRERFPICYFSLVLFFLRASTLSKTALASAATNYSFRSTYLFERNWSALSEGDNLKICLDKFITSYTNLRSSLYFMSGSLSSISM